MNSIESEIENRLLRTVDELKNVTVLDRVFESLSERGPSFSSDAFRLTLRYAKVGGEEGEKSFFVKNPYNHPNYDALSGVNFYARERRVYEMLSPVKSLLPPDDWPAPVFYGTDGRDALILEDLSLRGYQKRAHYEQLDLEHCAVALRSLAAFHAVGVRVDETRPRTLDAVRQEGPLMMSAFLPPENRGAKLRQRISDVVGSVDPAFAAAHPEVLRFFGDQLLRMARAQLEPHDDAFNVPNHGHFAAVNVMFAYDAAGRPTRAKCFDFQVRRWASAAVDVMYFSVMSMRVRVFREHFDQLLETYVNAVNETLERVGSERTLTVDQLRRDIGRTYKFLLYILLMYLPRYIRGPEEAAVATVFDDDIWKVKRYGPLSKFWIRYLIEKGVFADEEDTAVAVRRFISKYESENGVVVSKYRLENDVVEPGHNMYSGILRLKFEHDPPTEDEENANRRSVILKIPSLSANYKMAATIGLYHVEAYVYEKFLPRLHLLRPAGQRFSAACYATTEAGALVLEDLIAGGYRAPDKETLLDQSHCDVALRKLAAYHAGTVKLLRSDAQGEGFALPATSRFECGDTPPSIRGHTETWYEKLLQFVEPFTTPSLYEKVRQHRELVWPTFVTQMVADDQGLNVVAHNDFKPSNILFAYDDDDDDGGGGGGGGRVRDAVFVDWQMSRVTSPAVELIHFFTRAIPFDLFETRYDALLELYLRSLNDALTALECEVRYARVELDEAMRRYRLLYMNFAIRGFHTGDVPPDYLTTLLKWLNHLEKNRII